jgi:hypothetical protein
MINAATLIDWGPYQAVINQQSSTVLAQADRFAGVALQQPPIGAHKGVKGRGRKKRKLGHT